MDSSSSFLGLFRDFSKLAVIQSVIKAAFCDQIIMSTLLNNAAVFHNKDQVCVSDRRKAMGNDKAGSAFHHPFEGFLNLQLGTGIDAGGCLVENQHGRQAEHDAGDAEKLFLALA